jgi:hypothetical protein
MPSVWVRRKSTILDIPKAAFSNLAFGAGSRKLLAYRMTADEARKRATEIAPGAQMKVLVAGQYGRTVWNRKLSLKGAQQALTRARGAA